MCPRQFSRQLDQQLSERISTWTHNGTKASSQSAIGGSSMRQQLAGRAARTARQRPSSATIALRVINLLTVLKGQYAGRTQSIVGHYRVINRICLDPWDPELAEHSSSVGWIGWTVGLRTVAGSIPYPEFVAPMARQVNALRDLPLILPRATSAAMKVLLAQESRASLRRPAGMSLGSARFHLAARGNADGSSADWLGPEGSGPGGFEIPVPTGSLPAVWVITAGHWRLDDEIHAAMPVGVGVRTRRCPPRNSDVR